MTAHATINKIAGEVSAMFLEREEPIRGMMLALLSRSHLFLGGIPGVAKTALVSEITSRITGAEMFETLLDRFSPSEVVFGPVSIRALQEDKYERVIDGYAPSAHVVFLSEIWKCNSALLNALLMLLNERKFKNGTATLNCPLITAVGDSNETPEDSSLVACFDRFLLRYTVNCVSSANVINLLDPTFGQAASKTMLPLATLVQAQSEVVRVVVPRNILETIAELKAETTKEGYVASDRRWRASIRLLQACAWLDGRASVEADDLLIYSNVLWDQMADAAKVGRIVGKFINPTLTQIQEHIDQIDILLKAFVAKGGGEQEYINAMTKIRTHNDKLGQLNAGAKGEALKEQTRQRIKAAVQKTMKM